MSLFPCFYFQLSFCQVVRLSGCQVVILCLKNLNVQSYKFITSKAPAKGKKKKNTTFLTIYLRMCGKICTFVQNIIERPDMIHRIAKRLTTLLVVLCVGIVATAAVIPDMRFRRLDTREGLSNSMVNSILRDSQGYVWFGTAFGLNRYDGYRIRSYFSYDKDTTSLRNNRIDEIQEGYGGRLWLKQGMNYAVYDPVTRYPSRLTDLL